MSRYDDDRDTTRFQDEPRARRSSRQSSYPSQSRGNQGYDQHDEDYQPQRGSQRGWSSDQGYPSSGDNRYASDERESYRDSHDRREPRSWSDEDFDSPPSRAPRQRYSSPDHNREDNRYDPRAAEGDFEESSGAQRWPAGRSLDRDRQQFASHGRSRRDEFDDQGRYGSHGSDRFYEDDQRASRSSRAGSNESRSRQQHQGGYGGQFRGANRGGQTNRY